MWYELVCFVCFIVISGLRFVLFPWVLFIWFCLVYVSLVWLVVGFGVFRVVF